MPALRVGILGLSHDHVWSNVAALAAGGYGRLVAASDADPRLRERLHGLDGSVALLDSHAALLGRRDLDAVLSSTTIAPPRSSGCAPSGAACR